MLLPLLLALTLAAPQREAIVARPLPPVVMPESAFEPTPLTSALQLRIEPFAGPRVSAGFPSSSHTNFYPADAAGAVSASYVVGTFNSGVIVHDRAGNVLSRLTMPQFWGKTGTLYDPRAVYDARADRFVVITLYDEREMLVAISESGDPAGAWRRFSIDMSDLVVDFTRIAITRDHVIAASNYFYGTVLLMLPRASMYSASSLTLDRVEIDGAMDLAPVSTDDSTDRTFIVATEDRLHLWELTPSTFTRLGAYQPPFSHGPDIGLAPQLGGGTVDAGISDVQGAVYRGGEIHVVNAAYHSANGVSAILVWTITPGSSQYSVIALEDPEKRVWYAFPAIDVNLSGGAVIGFSMLSPDMHPSSAFIYRSPAGEYGPRTLLKAGEARARVTTWGDYNTVVVDPADRNSFWIVTTYGAANVNWATWWAKVEGLSPRRRVVRH